MSPQPALTGPPAPSPLPSAGKGFTPWIPNFNQPLDPNDPAVEISTGASDHGRNFAGDVRTFRDTDPIHKAQSQLVLGANEDGDAQITLLPPTPTVEQRSALISGHVTYDPSEATYESFSVEVAGQKGTGNGWALRLWGNSDATHVEMIPPRLSDEDPVVGIEIPVRDNPQPYVYGPPIPRGGAPVRITLEAHATRVHVGQISWVIDSSIRETPLGKDVEPVTGRPMIQLTTQGSGATTVVKDLVVTPCLPQGPQRTFDLSTC